MSIPDAPAPNLQAPTSANPIVASLARGLASPQLGALLTLASALTLGVGLIVWTMQPDYVPVSEQTSRADALSIIEALKSSEVAYKIDPTSGLVLVPKDQLSQIQLSLAASGLSDSSDIGLELLNNEPSLGVSHFTETARYQHALEIELSRTISSMRNVDAARVHLALPKQSVFVRDREQASASIMVRAKQGRSIEQEQVNAIVNLVASSIPFLESAQVTVVDQWGRLLSAGNESGAGDRREQYQYARKLENLYAERIETLLTPIVGKGRVRATVTAEFDFSFSEQTQESFEPDPAQLRSEQLDTQQSSGAALGAVGIPGALSNQPPAAGVTDIAQQTGAEPAEQENASNSKSPENGSSSSLRNFELDKTISHTRRSPGEIRRLSAAIIIDDQEAVDADGNSTRQSISDDELEQYAQLAREAIGYNEARGDSVIIMNRAFQPEEELLPVEPLPIWQQDWLWNMVKQTLVGISVLLMVLLVLRPAVKRLNFMSGLAVEDANSKQSQLTEESTTAAAGGTKKGDGLLESPPVVYGDILNMARAMAEEDPKRVALVVKDWVSNQ